MTTSQQALFADTIIAMKKTLKRRAYESEDSEDDIDYRGNRGQKLKKRARFAHQGQLAPPSGPEVYKEYVSHAGYTRSIISRNPPLVDDEGYEPESDDEDYEKRMRELAEAAAELNPYANLRLENILAPLAAVTDLPSHPTLSRPYTSKTLTELTVQAREIAQKENAALWKVKHLHTKFVGDQIWVPTELMETPNDLDLYQENLTLNGSGQRSVNSDASMPLLDNWTSRQTSSNGEAPASANPEGDNKDIPADVDTSMVDPDVTLDDESTLNDETRSSNDKGKEREPLRGDDLDENSSMTVVADGSNEVSSKAGAADKQSAGSTKDATTNGHFEGLERNGEPTVEHALKPVPDASGTDPGPGNGLLGDALDEMAIHPIFLAPKAAQPNRDVGIPEAEAEDLRRLLQLYVQKQEEVCRGAKRLNEGLLRAERLRKTVFQWSKYEAHVGPNRDMSDGEDWYDKEEWGFDEDLKKGQDEEEEDTTAREPKKTTRARR